MEQKQRAPSRGRKAAYDEGAVRALLGGAAADTCRLLQETINDPQKDMKLRLECGKTVLERVCGKPGRIAEEKQVRQVVFIGEERIPD